MPRSPISPEERTSTSTLPTSAAGSSRKSSASAKLLEADSIALGRRLDGVSFCVRAGETLAVLGPSGAGKTSLLRSICGLESIDSGDVRLDGRSVTQLQPQDRRIALVFQDDTLFPHLTLEKNMTFGMRPADSDRVRDLARALEIEDVLRERPGRVSGGERRRAALARALLSDPAALLLDEPLAHLDPQLRIRVREAFARVMRAWGGPAVFVTHDHEEALAAGDRVAILIEGRLVQCGAPRDVYDRPATLQAARFLGMPWMNVLDGPMITAIRSEFIRIDPRAELRGTVLSTEHWGADSFVRAATPRGELLARVRSTQPLPQPGDETGFLLDEQHVLRYDRITGQLL